MGYDNTQCTKALYPPTNKNITQHQSAEARRLGSSKFQRSNISKNKQTNKIKQKPPTRSSSYNHIYIYTSWNHVISPTD